MKIITLFALSYESLMDQKTTMEEEGWRCIGDSVYGYDEPNNQEFWTQNMVKSPR